MTIKKKLFTFFNIVIKQRNTKKIYKFLLIIFIIQILLISNVTYCEFNSCTIKYIKLIQKLHLPNFSCVELKGLNNKFGLDVTNFMDLTQKNPNNKKIFTVFTSNPFVDIGPKRYPCYLINSELNVTLQTKPQYLSSINYQTNLETYSKIILMPELSQINNFNTFNNEFLNIFTEGVEKHIQNNLQIEIIELKNQKLITKIIKNTSNLIL